MCHYQQGQMFDAETKTWEDVGRMRPVVCEKTKKGFASCGRIKKLEIIRLDSTLKPIPKEAQDKREGSTRA